MKITLNEPSRGFVVGNTVAFTLYDCGTVALAPDEQVTFVTDNGAEFDVARKDWGFYATPSLNGRLAQFGLRAVLIRNRNTGRYFILLVERGREPAFDAYLERELCDVIVWLDTTESLDRLRAAVVDAGDAP